MAKGTLKRASDNVLAFYNSVEENVYHYTSPEGLKGILVKEGEKAPTLFFTRYDCLNDASEGEIAKEIYKSAVEKYALKNPAAETFCDRIKNLEASQSVFLPEEDLSDKEKEESQVWSGSFYEFSSFLCCFSREPDSLSMWRYYSKGSGFEGYGIGFNRYKIVNSNILFKPLPVIYDRNLQEEILLWTIDNAFYNYSVNDHPIEIVSLMISSALNEAASQFKNEAFKDEKEFRIVLYMPKEIEKYKERTAFDVPKWLEIQYRINNGILIPYIDVPVCACGINSITVGPFQHKALAAKTLQEYLNGIKDYNHIQVECSKIPVRF